MTWTSRTPEAVTAALERMAEVAPQVQDDFDLQEGVLAELELAERPENQVPRPNLDSTVVTMDLSVPSLHNTCSCMGRGARIAPGLTMGQARCTLAKVVPET